MKKAKKILSVLLFLTMLVTLFPVTANAETKNTIPTKIRMYNRTDERAIEIELADITQSIGNVKTDSKNLFAKVTSSELNQEQGYQTDQMVNKNKFTVGLRSKKNGSYTVSFDILNKDGNKVETKKVKVYAYSSPVKSITFGGKTKDDHILAGKSAKVKVTLNKGNKIDKLEYGVYKLVEDEYSIMSEEVYKTFKNGANVTFGKMPSYYESNYSSEYDDYLFISNFFSNGMDAPTFIRITYYDKYTKQNETYTEIYITELE